MRTLHFDRFSEEPEIAKPFDEIGDGIKLGFDGNVFGRLGVVAVRNSVAADQKGEDAPYIVVEANNFETTDWFTLEIGWPEQFARLETRLRVYPCTFFRQRLYFSAGGDADQYVDLQDVGASDSFFCLIHYLEDLYRSNGVPRDATNLRLNLMIPVSNWFTLGIMSLNESVDA